MKMFVQAEYASHSMLKSRKLLILICVLAIGTESVIALPDKYEIQGAYVCLSSILFFITTSLQ